MSETDADRDIVFYERIQDKVIAEENFLNYITFSKLNASVSKHSMKSTVDALNIIKKLMFVQGLLATEFVGPSFIERNLTIINNVATLRYVGYI